ncbi:MAG: DNA polymerase III subunit gamma/tau [Candidatus Muiribacteriota bacterium]
MNLYRKYRPNNFSDMVQQDFAVGTLKNSIISNRIAHAYLFAGPRGTGKTSLAKIYAKALNCLDEKSFEPCNKCKNCEDFNKNTFIDYFEIDAASNRKVEEMRDLIEKVKYMPVQGQYKVYVIDEAHMLTREASNAFLKTLEEPPSHVIFILATTEPHKILNTIKSRCQFFDFHRLGVKKIRERLKLICKKEKIKISDEALDYISHYAEGGLRDALSILDQLWAFSDSEVNMDVINSVFSTSGYDSVLEFIYTASGRKYTEILDYTTRLYEEGTDFNIFLEDILRILKDLIYFKWNPQKTDFLPYIKNNLEKINKIPDDFIYQMLDSVNKEYYSLKKSEDIKLGFELLIFRFLKNEKDSQKESDKKETVPEKIKVAKKTIFEKKSTDENNFAEKENKFNKTTVLNAWHLLVENIAQKNLFISTCLSFARKKINMEKHELMLIFPAEFQFHVNILKRVHDLLNEEFNNILCKKFKINIEILKNKPDNNIIEKEKTEEEKALNSPFVEKLNSKFKIKNIKKV